MPPSGTSPSGTPSPRSGPDGLSCAVPIETSRGSVRSRTPAHWTPGRAKCSRGERQVKSQVKSRRSLVARVPGTPDIRIVTALCFSFAIGRQSPLSERVPPAKNGAELYQEASTYCHPVKDYVSRDLFEELMADEEDDIDFLETQLDLAAKLGLELYAQHHIGEPDED